MFLSVYLVGRPPKCDASGRSVGGLNPEADRRHMKQFASIPVTTWLGTDGTIQSGFVMVYGEPTPIDPADARDLCMRGRASEVIEMYRGFGGKVPKSAITLAEARARDAQKGS